MKDIKLFITLLIVIILLAGCSKPTENISQETAEQETEETIEHEVIYNDEIAIGETGVDGSAIMLPENTFDENVVVTVETSDEYTAESFQFIGKPLSVRVKGKDNIRLNQPATLTFKIPEIAWSVVL
jgi:PBP1b-binding outer membrane lipoprotein LpoB